MGKEKETCNICETPSYLTEDHVPPKCCSNKGNVNFYRLFDTNFNPKKNQGKPKKASVLKPCAISATTNASEKTLIRI